MINLTKNLISSNFCGFITIFLVLISNYSVLEAQTPTSINDDSLFSKTHFSIIATGTQSSFTVNAQTGPNKPFSGYSFGYEGGINLTINLSKYIGIQIGIGAGEQNYNYYPFTIVQNGEKSYAGTSSHVGYVQAPIELIGRKRIGNHIILFGGAGIIHRFYFQDDVNVGSSGFLIQGDSNSKATIKYKEIVTAGASVLIIPRIELGILVQLKNYDLLKFGFSFDLGNAATYTATYNYIDFKGNDIGSGSYNANAPYLGVNIGYIFTRASKH
jgi:hypothetical protein